MILANIKNMIYDEVKYEYVYHSQKAYAGRHC